MKRLLPFDGDGAGPGDVPHTQADVAPRAENAQCAIPGMFDPRRTVMFAVVSKVEPDSLYVQESPAEIMPFRDTERVRFGYLPPEGSARRTRVTITDRTCIDLSMPLEHLEQGTPLIVFGINTGGTIEAEILAGIDAEPRYRSALRRYQNHQDWHRPMSTR